MRLLGLFCIPFLIFACKPNKQITPLALAGGKVLCLGEGNFGWGNADFTIYKEQTNQVINNAFKKTNGSSIGDVLQSGILWGNQIFLIVNNSNKIVVLDTGTFKVKNQLLGFDSPRYLQPINDSVALVTELYANKLHLIHRSKGIIRTIWIKAMCEKMDKNNETIAIACKKGWVYFFNTNTQSITDSVNVKEGCGNVVYAFNSWFAFSVNNSKSYLYKINHKQVTILNDTNSKIAYLHIRFNAITQSWVLASNNAIYNGNANLSSITEVYNLPKANFYGLGIHPKNGEIFIANSTTYTEPGNIICLNKVFNIKNSFEGEIIPSEFVFIP